MNSKERFQELAEQAEEIWRMLAAHCYINERGEAELLDRAKQLSEEMGELARKLEEDKE